MWALRLLGFAVLCVLVMFVAKACINFLSEKREKLGSLEGFLVLCLCIGFGLAQFVVMFVAGPLLLPTSEIFTGGMVIWGLVMCWPMRGLANPYG